MTRSNENFVSIVSHALTGRRAEVTKKGENKLAYSMFDRAGKMVASGTGNIRCVAMIVEAGLQLA